MMPDTLNSLSKTAAPVFAPKQHSKPRTTPFLLRLTDQERAELSARAGSMPLGAYVKSELFSGRQKVRRKTVGSIVDQKSLAKALALLGQSRFSSNLNQIAKAVNLGTLPLTLDVETDIKTACDHISEIRALLVQALGLKSGGRR